MEKYLLASIFTGALILNDFKGSKEGRGRGGDGWHIKMIEGVKRFERIGLGLCLDGLPCPLKVYIISIIRQRIPRCCYHLDILRVKKMS